MKIRFTLVLLLFAAAGGALALAGPPLICHPVAIGTSQSLPWNDDGSWNGMVATYDTRRLVRDTLSLLGPQTPAEVRIETLRRAAIYTSRDPSLAQALMSRLYARVHSGRDVDSTALFDAGYFGEAVRETAEAYVMIHDPALRAAWKLRSPPHFELSP